jgi:hypothetical protein
VLKIFISILILFVSLPSSASVFGFDIGEDVSNIHNKFGFNKCDWISTKDTKIYSVKNIVLSKYNLPILYRFSPLDSDSDYNLFYKDNKLNAVRFIWSDNKKSSWNLYQELVNKLSSGRKVISKGWILEYVVLESEKERIRIDYSYIPGIGGDRIVSLHITHPGSSFDDVYDEAKTEKNKEIENREKQFLGTDYKDIKVN